jgi:putative transposase
VILASISEAVAAGARVAVVCTFLGISARTVERWRARPEGDDQRRGPRRQPGNALSRAEEAEVIKTLTSPRFAGLSPKLVVPLLADEDGEYLASEATMYRIQRKHGLRNRRRAQRHNVTRARALHRATGPNQVWSWDITWLPTTVRGRYFYLYMFIDVWSRRIVGWEVHEREGDDLAAALVRRICDETGIDPAGLILHADNGNAMRGSTMIATLYSLGIKPSFSRPHVSDDNPYSESLFNVLKHTPAYPSLPFADADAARAWVTRFVAWYNTEHRHSGIRFVTPDERHFGAEESILRRRDELYQTARRRRPERWSRQTRNWTPIGLVALNPDPAQKREAA